LLALAGRHRFFMPFKNSLVAVDFSNRRFGKNAGALKQRLWIKTGSMEGVYALAGYLSADSGDLLCFHFNINNIEIKAYRIHPLILNLLQVVGNNA
jgi:D-alanyl-D-alanine carboxypeptidase